MDVILYNILIGLSCFFVGYLFGSIPFGVIVGKVFYKKDPRDYGSKNSGGTNVGRVFSKKAGVLTIILDMLKCVIPMLLAFFVILYTPLKTILGEDWLFDDGIIYYYLAPLGATVGHCFPLFAKFKGGKIVANLCGFGLATSWLVSIFGIITFFTTLKTTKYVSLSSILTSIVGTIVAWAIAILNLYYPAISNLFMWGNGYFVLPGFEYATTLTIMTFITIIRHHTNIKRLINHEENKVKWLK